MSVITTVTAINRSGLRAGMLPLTPVYANWQDAYYQLGKQVCHSLGLEIRRVEFLVVDF